MLGELRVLRKLEERKMWPSLTERAHLTYAKRYLRAVRTVTAPSVCSRQLSFNETDCAHQVRRLLNKQQHGT